MSDHHDFDFIINSEPQHTERATGGHYVDIVFTVQNRSGRQIRVEVEPEALFGPESSDGTPLPPAVWQSWLELREADGSPLKQPDWLFGISGVKTYTLRVHLPKQLRLGTYQLRLVIIGVDDPDHIYKSSDIVTFAVTGPELNLRRFVIVALIVLAVIIGLAVGAALLFEPEPRLVVMLEAPPDGGVVGEVMTYTITVENARQISATKTVLTYQKPDDVVAATAVVNGAAYRTCDETNSSIVCDLGVLSSRQMVTITILAVPGPGTAVITNTNTVSVSSWLELNQAITPAEVNIEESPVLSATGISAVIDPNMGILTVEEPVTIKLLAWNNVTQTDALTMTYQLPQGMRYRRLADATLDTVLLPPQCHQQPDDYFTVTCVSGPLGFANGQPEIAEFNLVAIPNAISPGLVHQIEVSTADREPDELPVVRELELAAVSSALTFNGVDEYAELGYAAAPESFTVEFWVHPFSNSDGQSFIGVHRETLENLNLFLVGFWSDGLNITIGEDFHSLTGPKLTERQHIAVVVEKMNAQESRVTVYVNGQPRAWVEPEDVSVCDYCKIFAGALDGNPTLPWVLGQEWDPIGNSIRPSDFFRGALSDVRIWNTPRTQEEIQTNINKRVLADEPNLLAYLTLVPADRDSGLLADRVGQPGERLGANWGEAIPRFGSALAFDGMNDFLNVPELQLADFEVMADGKVAVTLSGWVYVDSIPTEEQWLMGYAGPAAGTLTLAGSGGTPTVLPSSEEAALATALDVVNTTAATQANLAAAQGELIAATAVRDALGIDEPTARLRVEEARNVFYLTIEQLADLNLITGAYTPVAEVVTAAETQLGASLDQLQLVAGVETAVQEARLARTAHEMTVAAYADVTTTGPFTSADQIRARLQPRQTELAYAQTLVNLWQILAQNNITATGIIDAPLPLTPAAQAAARLTAVVDTQNSLNLPNQALLSLSALELAEQQQLVAAFLVLTGDLDANAGTAVNATPIGLVDPARQQAAETIQAADARFTAVLTDLQPWLQEQLNTDVLLYLFPELGTAIRDDALRQRLYEESGLIGYWNFNEGGGATAQDGSGNGYDGQLVGDAAFISRVPVVGESDNPFALSAVPGGAVRVPDAARILALTNNFSLSAWVQPQGILGGGQRILDVSSSDAQGDGFIWYHNNGALLFSTPGVTDPYVVTQTLELNTWQHVAVVMDGRNAVTYYVNGVAAGTVAGNGPVNAPQNGRLQIGQLFDGLIDDVRIYNRSLSAEEVAILAQGSAPINIEEQITFRKLLGLHATSELQAATAVLASVRQAEDGILAAQGAVAAASSEADRIEAITVAAEQTLAETAVLEANVAAAQQRVLTAPPAEQQAAQAELAQAQAALAAARADRFRSLQSAMASLSVREETLQDLSIRLDVAINNAVEAGVAAAQKNNVELLIGPFLDWILGTRTPRPSTQQVVEAAALLAAQQALKAEVDFNVDAAQAKLDAAIETRDRLITSGGNARLRQEIINNINNYINSLNGEVDEARQELEEARTNQQGRQQPPEIPLVLADALSQEVARLVTNQVLVRIRPSYRQLLLPDPAVSEAIKTQLRSNLSGALAASRNPVRWQLYIDTYLVGFQLNQQIAAGNFASENERTLTIQLRDRLLAVNLAVLRLLNAQNVVLRPRIGFESLISQVADERNRAASEEALLQELQDAISNARLVLETYIQLQNVQGAVPVDGRFRGGLFKPAAGNGTIFFVKVPLPLVAGNGQHGIGQEPTPEAPATPAGVGDTGRTAAGDAIINAVVPGGGSPEVTPVQSSTVTTTAVLPTPPLPTAPLVPPNIWLGLGIDDDGHVFMVARPNGGGQWTAVKDEKPIPVGQWVHYAGVAVFDPQTNRLESFTLQLFRDGDEVKGFDLTANPLAVRYDLVNCAPGFYIGGLCSPGGQFAFKGWLDDIRVWDRVLTEKEIDSWQDLPGEFYDEFAYWGFDDGPGRSSAALCDLALTCDRSANGYHLRVVGPSWVEADFGLNAGVESR